MATKRKSSRYSFSKGLYGVVLTSCVVGALAMVALSLNRPIVPQSSVLSAMTNREETAVMPVTSMMTQDGNRTVVSTATDTSTWIGTMSGPNMSYLGLLFDRSSLPVGAVVTNARLQLTAYHGSRVPLKLEVRGLVDPKLTAFTPTTILSSLAQTSNKKDISLTTAWTQGQRYTLDVTSVATASAGLSIRGIGNRYAFRTLSLAEESAPTLIITYLPVSPSLAGPTGDCNGDGVLNAGDYSALALEIGDQDGDSLKHVAQGNFRGTEQCDVNYDGKVNAIDYTCMRRKVFESPTACDEFAAPVSAPGDCNGDTKVDAGDLSALSLELADLDGTTRERVQNSTYTGFQGCDANGDGKVTTADRTCTSNLVFGKTCN